MTSQMPSDSNISDDRLRVLLIDDSVVVRGLLRKIIDQTGDIKVVATAMDGKMGVQQYKACRPDVVLMDVEMPVMNGIESLQAILELDPLARVIMCSSLTQKGADMAIRALQAGAIDCLAKPSSHAIERGIDFEQQLLMMLRNVAHAKPDALRKAASPAGAAPQNRLQKRLGHDDDDVQLRPFPAAFEGSRPRVLSIGSSTGGPTALKEIVPFLKPDIHVPVFITQHMPAGFTKLLADSLNTHSPFPVQEGADGMIVKPGQVYIAPGGMHMTVEQRGIDYVIVLDDGPPVHYCKPSVDVMLDSILATYKTGIVSVIITGMGEDGLAANRRVIEQSDKNILIAQDALTSVVWGMPGAVAKAGLCHKLVSISNIAPVINQLLAGRRPLF